MDVLLGPLTVAAAVGSGLVAGVFLAFSVAVMPALARSGPAQGVAVMQTVNRVIVGPLFLLVFVGTAALSAALVVVTLLTAQPGAALRVSGAALYLVGAFGVTAAVNVPLNNALDGADAAGPDATRAWERYHPRWTAWNHVRAAAGTAAALALTVTLTPAIG